MRIIIVNDNAVITGGATKCALLSAEYLAKLGHEVHYVSGFSKVDSYYEGLGTIKFHSLNRPDTPMSMRKLVELSYVSETYDLVRKLIAEGDPQTTIVHSHLWKTGVSPSFVNAAIDGGAHLLCTFHDYHVACPSGQFFNSQTDKICTLKPGSLPCLTSHCTRTRTILPKWVEVYRWSVQKRRAGLPDRVKNFGILSPMSLEAFGDFLPKDAKIFPITNPIQCTKAPRVDAARNKEFVFLGRLSNEKDPQTLLEASRKIGAKVRFLGDGPLRSVLEASKYEGATFSGWINSEEIDLELNSARAFVIPSIWYEVSPLAPLEAMSKGIPVITSDCCATKFDVADGETGFVFQHQNVDDLAAKMQVLMDDSLADRMSQTAYDRFWENPPTPENHAKRLVEVYTEIMSAK